ncbi:hypothetical protein SA496_02255 [Pseudomonas sp. JS3066]|uniref:hypothetical protein n=1 Tax=unclassified Pseudomonas TaxID=196821 RepID=UPI002E7B2565|nr:hypothetical protein [Pseudomonas sp. JS3066]WVK94034.1 hypothetical protein SA496_02255 [Pseudomonas sp. JS3066]
MKTYLAIGLLLLSSMAMAAFPDDGAVIYEGATVLTVSAPQEQYLLVYECESCTPVKMSIAATSVIRINGSTSTLERLFTQARWRADVFAEAGTPTTISRISTY